MFSEKKAFYNKITGRVIKGVIFYVYTEYSEIQFKYSEIE